ncbi:MAG TPA: hypothetical protein VHE34_18805 [Puia sp.]|uniref:hypothetical protein n=1 Tax=Puia sp. TaxID=2045100 RepID=UPI002C8D790B|nr:hypothetical protein [Puia sp.]HVU97291.1 hypothetical protein [Puia sp.]
MTKLLLFLNCFFVAAVAFAQYPVGNFEDHLDIGNPKMRGDASYDATTQVYSLSGGGANIWLAVLKQNQGYN